MFIKDQNVKNVPAIVTHAKMIKFAIDVNRAIISKILLLQYGLIITPVNNNPKLISIQTFVLDNVKKINIPIL